MSAENTRRQNKIASAATSNGKPSFDRKAITVRAASISWLSQLASELTGAIEDHRKWINSDRARTLGTTFDVSGRIFAYAAYIALAYLAFNSFVGIRNGIATGIYAIPEQNDGSRVALFNMLAGGLVGPIILGAIGIGIGWIYNLTTAAANRILPRFVRAWVHPSIMFAIVAAVIIFNAAFSQTVAKGYLYAKANIEAASPQVVIPEKVIEIPGPDIADATEESGPDSSGERELVRLRSMFASSRPCSTEVQETELDPQSEVARPEPGLAITLDCQAGKIAPHE